MAEALTSVKHALEDITECAICHDVYTDPRSLPCIHTFCLKCISKWFQGKRPKDSVNCPLCRKEFEIPSNGLVELPKNIFIGKLLALKELAGTSDERKLCGWCTNDTRIVNETNTATAFCIDCQDYLCESCKGPHSRLTSTRSHRMPIPVEGLSEAAFVGCMSSKCDKHTDKDLEIHCFDCKDTVCLMCFVTQHNGHKASDVKEVVGEFKLKLNENISKLADVVSKLDRSLATMETKRSHIVDQACKIEDEIYKKAEELKRLIDSQKDKLLSEVQQLKVGKSKLVDNAMSEAKQNKAMIESLMTYSQELLQKGSNSDITRESKSLYSRMEEVVKICNTDFSFNVSEQLICFTPADIISATTSCVGEVKASETDRQSLRMEARHTIPAVDKVWAVAALGKELFTATGGAGITVYDTSTFQQTRQISIPKCSAFGLATCATNNCLYVSDRGNCMIHKVSLSSTQSAVFPSWTVAPQPAGLAVNRTHNILVACDSSMRIQKYSSTGSLMREVSVVSTPWQAVELHDGKLFVITRGPVCGVCVMSVDGRVLRSYTSTKTRSRSSEQDISASSLAVDKKGSVFIAEYFNNRILLFKPASRGKFSQLPYTITKPISLWLDESHGRLYVGEFNIGDNSQIRAFDV